MARRMEVAIELAKKDKIVFDSKMKDKSQRAEIEKKRLRILEADNAKIARMKDMMDKAQAAYQKGEYAEAEAFALRAQEIDPNEVAPVILAFKANAERHWKVEMENKRLKEDATVIAFQEVDKSSIADPEVQLKGIKFPKNFKDLTRDRLRMNAMLEPKKAPQTLAIESKLNDPVSLNMDKQPLQEAIDFLRNYTGMNIVLDPKALNDENITSATPVTLAANNIRLRTALKLLAQPAGADLQDRGRGAPDHQSAGVAVLDDLATVLRRRPGAADAADRQPRERTDESDQPAVPVIDEPESDPGAGRPDAQRHVVGVHRRHPARRRCRGPWSAIARRSI